MAILAGDTIAAISTPPGRGGIGIVRLSGPRAKPIAESLVRLRNPLEPSRARFGEVLESQNPESEVPNSEIPNPETPQSSASPTRTTALDEAVVTWFAAPHSYTSEDVVEIAAHGSPVLLDHLLRQCIAHGARLAEPGEFTQRAFFSGRLDLTQAEAVQSLIAATTLEQARTAARQLGGALSRQVQPVKERLIALIAGLEAGIDFAEDDLDLMPAEDIATRLREIAAPLQAMEHSFAYGRMISEGFRLAIVGRPNAGKSSLFNRLIGRDRAIVTPHPGTTRDPIAERLDFAGIPVELVDTAGLRATTDEAEIHGVLKSREAIADADVILLVIAADAALHPEDIAVRDAASGRNLIVARNKIDLAGMEALNLSSAHSPELWPEAIGTSALDGTGIDRLRQAILAVIQATPAAADAAPLTSLRQHQAVTAALNSVRCAVVGAQTSLPHEMLLLDLHECLDSLDLLTGTTHSDQILNLIFSTFCVGK